MSLLFLFVSDKIYIFYLTFDLVQLVGKFQDRCNWISRRRKPDLTSFSIFAKFVAGHHHVLIAAVGKVATRQVKETTSSFPIMLGSIIEVKSSAAMMTENTNSKYGSAYLIDMTSART